MFKNLKVIVQFFVILVFIGGTAWGATYYVATNGNDIDANGLSWEEAKGIDTASDLEYKPGELLVRFAPKAENKQRTLTERNAVLAAINGGTVRRSYKLVPGLSVVKLPTNRTVENVLSTFKITNGILYAEPNYKIKLISTFPNEQDFGYFQQLWGMHNTGWTGGTPDADIDAPEAWDIVTDSNIIVAVIDTGVDYNHPDLAANMWVNEAELNGDPNVDDDDNGYIDDIYGYDFCTYGGKQRDSDPVDDHLHGTHVAGTIGAIGNNNEGVVGVCWNVKIMALKFLNLYGTGYTADAIDCIEYAVDKGAKVLNNSWGGGSYSQSLKDAIDAADANGVLFIAAAGNGIWGNPVNNDTNPQYPSSYDSNNIIAVLSTDRNDDISDHLFWASNYGATSVDLGAPGSGIMSTFPTYMTPAMVNYGFSTDYATISGTSMATPHVAGACALVWAANPELSHLEVKDYLLNSVDKTLPGLCVSEGKLNLLRAVKGKQYSPLLILTKDVNDANCVYPWDIEQNYLTYTISYDANGFDDTNVVLIDYLPKACDYYSSNPNGDYNSVDHTVTWTLGDFTGSETDSIQLTTKVNYYARPNGTFTNLVIMESDTYLNETRKDVSVCCWGDSDIIYVDEDANGFNNGTTWDDAYTDLQEAFTVARDCASATAIWVAAGTYKPVNSMGDDDTYKDAAFELIYDVGLFGHFAGTESSTSERDLSDPNNETILEGRIGQAASEAVEYVVTAKDPVPPGSSMIIDGFTIQNSFSVPWGSPTYSAGIYLNEDDLYISIGNCKLKANKYHGIQGESYSSADIYNCIFIDNYTSGIYSHSQASQSQLDISYCIFDGNSTSYNGITSSTGDSINIMNSVFENHTNEGIRVSSGSFTLENSVIRYNGGDGIWLYRPNNTTIINNNWIHDNNEAGIYFHNPSSSPLVRNNTIYNNSTYGIELNSGADPSIRNCIIYENDSGDLGGTFSNVNYCSLQTSHNGEGNITGDPGFVDAVNDNYHLDVNSPCINAGDPGFVPDSGETDIDGDNRVMMDRVDIGADEAIYPVHNTTQDSWYSSIQDAVSDAVELDDIVVYPGTYYENIDFDGKNLTLTGADPTDWSVTESTIIDGGGSGVVVTFNSGENATSELKGLTIRNAGTNGIICYGASPMVTDCIIEDSGTYGINLGSSAAPKIERNKIRGNATGIVVAYSAGSVFIRNNWIYDNSNVGILAISSSNITIYNNTIVDNTNGIWVTGTSPTISNCIIWDNNDDLTGCSATYSCIEDGDAGTGNISSDPDFVDYSNDDFHLTSVSPCINSGDPAGDYTGQSDIDGQARVQGLTVDMGADETPAVKNTTKNLWYETINAAVDDADEFDEIVVYPGTYYENIDFDGKNLTLTGADPTDWSVTESTIIDGGGSGAVVTFSSSENANSILKGLTIRNAGTHGIACYGTSPVITDCIIEDSGTYGINLGSSAAPKIERNKIRGNATGIVVAYSAGSVSIKNNWIYDNSNVGILAISSSNITIYNNTIVDNTNGIWVTGTSPTISNCIIWSNNDDLFGCSATYSCIEDGDAGTGNISSDPNFVDAANDDYHINSGSPCIDIGNPNGTYTGQTDIDGDNRVIDVTGKGDGIVDVDMGADEYNPNP